MESGSSRETDALMPRNPYSASKAGADRLAYSYFATYGLPVIVTRASNNYGPYQYPEKVIPLFITHALDDIPVPALRGRAERARLAARGRPLLGPATCCSRRGRPGETYNVGGGNEVRNLDLTRRILALARQAGEPDPARGRPPGPRPPLQPRLRQAARDGLGAGHAVRRGPATDGRLVPGATRPGGGRSRKPSPAFREHYQRHYKG